MKATTAIDSRAPSDGAVVDDVAGEAQSDATATSRRATLISIAAVVATAFHCWMHRRFTVDDAAITYAYARTFAEGHGFGAIAAGAHRVEGFSNLSWMLLLSFGHWIGVPEEIASKWLGVLCAAGATLSSALFLRTRVSHTWALSTVFFLPLSLPFVFWSVSGLESAAFAWFLLLLSLRLVIEDAVTRPYAPWSICLVWACATTRPEGVFFVVPALLFLAMRVVQAPPGERRQRLRRAVIWAALAGAGLVVLFAWRLSVFSYLWPNTVTAKGAKPSADAVLRMLLLQNVPGWVYVRDYFTGYGGVWLLWLAIVGAVRCARGPSLIIPLMTGASLALPLYSRDWMEHARFMVPFVVLSTGLVVLGTDTIAGRVREARWRRHWRWSVGMLLAVSLGAYVFVSLRVAIREAQHPHPTVTMEWVRDDVSALLAPVSAAGVRGSGAAPDIGATIYELGQRVLDLAGLVDVHISRMLRDLPFTGARGDLFNQYLFVEQRPAWIVTHPPWDYFKDLPRFKSDYLLVRDDASHETFLRRDLVVGRNDATPPIASGPGISILTVQTPGGGLVGNMLPVRATYRCNEQIKEPLFQRLILRDIHEKTAAEHRTELGYEWYPANKWSAGETFRQFDQVLLPLTPGTYRLTVEVLDHTLEPLAGATATTVITIASPGASHTTAEAISRAASLASAGSFELATELLEDARQAYLGDAVTMADIEREYQRLDDGLLAEARAKLAGGRVADVAACAQQASRLRGSRTSNAWARFGDTLYELATAARTAGDLTRAYELSLAASESNHLNAWADHRLEETRRAVFGHGP